MARQDPIPEVSHQIPVLRLLLRGHRRYHELRRYLLPFVALPAIPEERGISMNIPIDYTHFGSVPDDADLSTVETNTPQEQVQSAYVEVLEARLERMTKVCLAAQLSCNMGDARTAAAMLSQALTGL